MMYLVDLYNTIAEPEPPQTWPQKEFGNYFIFTANATITGSYVSSFYAYVSYCTWDKPIRTISVFSAHDLMQY